MADFPEHVYEVKNDLSKSNSRSDKKRYKTVECLTTADKEDEDKNCDFEMDLERLWNVLHKAEEDKGQTNSNEWVYRFLDDVIKFQNLPSYFYLNGEEKKHLISDIKECTAKLKKIYIDNDLDLRLVPHDDMFFGGFSYGKKSLKKAPPNTSIGEILDFFSEEVIEKICYYNQDARQVTNYKAVAFCKELRERNFDLYGTPKNEIVAYASNAIFKTNYQPSDIANFANRSFSRRVEMRKLAYSIFDKDGFA